MGKEQITVDAMQVPVPLSNEAAKDYEQRVVKVCAWLDSMGATNIDFTQVKRPGFDAVTAVNFKLKTFDGYIPNLDFGVPEGCWIVFFTEDLAVVISDEQFQKMKR